MCRLIMNIVGNGHVLADVCRTSRHESPVETLHEIVFRSLNKVWRIELPILFVSELLGMEEENSHHQCRYRNI